MNFTNLILVSSLSTLLCYPVSAENAPLETNNSDVLVSYGSDTLANLMLFWGEAYSKRYPNITLELHSEGSSTATKRLMNQTASLGPMSRLMSIEEVTEFKQKHGYAPTPIKVGMDSIAVFVNRDNPLSSISIQQLDAIYSKTRACGYPSTIDNWGELGLADWEDKTIELIGRNQVSGTYTFFRKKALCDGRFKSRVLNQPGSNSLVQVVSHSLYSIGFSGLGYKTAGVKSLSIVNDHGQTIQATSTTVLNQTYPLARFLYIYVNLPKHKKLPLKVEHFIKLALSEEGQAIVEKDGYVALSKAMRADELNKFLP